MEHAAAGEKPTTQIKIPTNFKSRIPQKIDAKIATSPTSGKFHSKIPRSTSLKYNNSSCKNEAEVVSVQRQVSEPTREEKCALIRDLQEENCDFHSNLECVTNGNAVGNITTNGNLYENDECNLQVGKSAGNYNCEEISMSNKFTEYSHNGLVTSSDFTTSLQAETSATSENNIDLQKCPFNEVSSDNDADFENQQEIGGPADNEVPQQLSFNNALTYTPTTIIDNVGIESLSDLNTPAVLNRNMEASKTSQPSNTNSTELPKNGFAKTPEDFPDEDFERTEHDNDDYTTTTTTEYEKDGKMIRTTETINYQNDRNIKTRVVTSEKIVTIPYGQQLDLTNPEITSSTTVRSKYLQTMLQSREFEGDKEVKAETLETIETDIETNKVDSNDNTNDPDLDTVLVIVETLDEVRTTEPKIRTFTGTTSNDPVYAELLDVLNKSLTKFEDIDPKGKESVTQKRQNGIEYIQRLIQKLNTKLQENEAKNPSTKPTANPQQPEAKVLRQPETNVQQKSNLVNDEKLATEPAAPDNTKKERKKSTLKKHFKLGNKNAKDEDKQEKKKKKKLCVIS